MGIGAEPLDDSGRPIAGWDSTNHRPAVPQITSTSVDSTGVVYGTMNVNATVPAVANQRVNAQAGDFVDGAIATIGAQSDTSATSDTGTFSLIALFKRALTKLTSIVTNTGNIPAQGQATMVASLPVVIASNQSAVPISGSITATNPSVGADGSAIPTSSTLLGASDGTNLQPLQVDGSKNLKVVQQGNVTEVNSAAIQTNTGNAATVLGATTDAAVTGDNSGTANAHLRGLTKILADIWDSVNHLLHTDVKQVGGSALALGSTTSASSIPVVIASDQGNLPGNVKQLNGTTVSTNTGTADGGTQRMVNAGAATGTKSNIASSASSVTILAANTSRKGAMIYNDSTQVLYLDLSGGTASNTSYSVQVPPNGFFELPGPTIYNGAITGIWASVNGNARVTEFS